MGRISRRSDAELLGAVRTGHVAAFGVLRERHAAAARALAVQLMDEEEAEEVVTAVFAGVFEVVRQGGGPEGGFRPFLLDTLRRAGGDLGATGPPEDLPPLVRAYLSLPGPWRTVLWHLEVEDARPAEVALLLGTSARRVAAQARQARDGLRQAYLGAYLAAGPPAECRPVLARLGTYAGDGTGGGEGGPIDRHLADCTGCRSAFHELADLRQGMRVVVGPRIAGPALPGYLAALRETTGGRAGAGRGGLVARLGEAARRQRFALTGTAVATGTIVASAFILVSGERPVDRAGPTPTAVLRTTPPPADPVPAPRRTPRREHAKPRLVPPPPAPPPHLVASIAPLGSLVRARPGIVGVRLRNEGNGPSAEVEAVVHLPRGVSLLPSARRGASVAVPFPAGAPAGLSCRPTTTRAQCPPPPEEAAKTSSCRRGVAEGRCLARPKPKGAAGVPSCRRTAATTRCPSPPRPAGTVDGWSCRPIAVGARCTRGPLGPGRGTAIFVRVLVDARAPAGRGPVVRVSAGKVRVAARAASGVRTAGAPARFATEGRTVTHVIGNTLLSCRADRPGCLRTRERAGAVRDNDLWEMRAVDADRDPATGNSSAARLESPVGGRVVWAGLYWSATGRAAAAGTIKVRPPGRARYTRVRAAEVTAVRFPTGPGYQAFADVTRLAVGGAEGLWWVADARFLEGMSRHAGWSLVVIVTDPRRPYRQTVVLDAAAMAGKGHGEVAIPLSGLTPAPSPARVHLVTWEGDADLGGDRVSVGMTALRPAGGDRDAANPFDGSAVGAVGATMTFGVDVDLFRPTLRPGAVLRVTSRKDAVLVGVAVVSVRTR